MLLVDDGDATRDVVTTALEDDGYRVLQARDWPSLEPALPGTAAAVVLAGATVERLPSVNEPRWHEKVQEHGYL